MSQLNFYKVSSLPATLQPSSLYFVENGNFSEGYITNKSGVAKGIGNSAMINQVATQLFASLSKSSVQVVADIAARNALVLTENTMVLVKNATTDPTVNSGAALYIYEKSLQTYSKIAEYESMDVTIAWAGISGRPTSTPAQIDNAVSASHNHTNKGVLDSISDENGQLTYKGFLIGSNWTTNAW